METNETRKGEYSKRNEETKSRVENKKK